MSTEAFFRVIDRKTRTHQLPVDFEQRTVEERLADFDEITCGFDIESAQAEAARCIQCPEPQGCMLNCPAGNDIPEALWLTSQGDFIGAAKVFAATSPLSEICGRVCPNLCQHGCVLSRCHGSASIGKIEAFVAGIARQSGDLAIIPPIVKTGKRVAVVGSGPTGLTVAEDLVKRGHQVTVFEAWPVAGGVLIYGIPSFKLNKQVVLNKINDLEQAGVNFITNTRIGDALTVDDLLRQYDAVFLGAGAVFEAKMTVPGENLRRIYTSTDFLIRTNVPTAMLPPECRQKPDIGQRVAVIGGGDTAVDCARSAIRLGAKDVTIIYHRTETEMPGHQTERAICREEGVKIEFLCRPVEYLGDDSGQVSAIKIIKMKPESPTSPGSRLVASEGSEFIQEIDTVILAGGYWSDPFLGNRTENLPHHWDLILTNKETGATSRKGVFATGDNVCGADLVVTMGIAAAHQSAKNIDAYLRGDLDPWLTHPQPMFNIERESAHAAGA